MEIYYSVYNEKMLKVGVLAMVSGMIFGLDQNHILFIKCGKKAKLSEIMDWLLTVFRTDIIKCKTIL